MNDCRALILAAGAAQRLRPLTDEVPKTLLPLKSKTILGHIVDCCVTAGLHHLSLVTGHGQEHVREECDRIKTRHQACTFSYIHCPEYREMGNVYSLYVARELFREPLILINSDLVFAHGVLAALLSSPCDSALLVDDSKELGSEEMKVAVRNGFITSISKNLDPATADGEYIGITKICPSIAEGLEKALHHIVQLAPASYYEDAFQYAIEACGVGFRKISTGGAACMEIDTMEDLALARQNAHLWV